MTTPEKTAIASHIATILLCGVVAFCCIAIALALSRTLDNVNTALATVNRSCAPGPCGTLANIDKAVVKAGDAIVTTQQQELVVTKQIRLDALAGVPVHINGTMDALSETATTASRSVQNLSDGLTPVLGHLDAATVDSDAAIKRLVPVEDDTDRAVRDFDARVTSQDVTTALKGVADTSQQLALTTAQVTFIAADFRKAADAATAPAPWWKKALGYGTLGVNIACLATHSCPF